MAGGCSPAPRPVHSGRPFNFGNAMTKQEAPTLPLQDWMVWMSVRDAQLSAAGVRAIRSLLAEKEARLHDPAPGTPRIPLSPDFEQG